MKIHFEKWHGCQNDFIVVWTNTNESKYLLPSLQRQANKLCNRQGLGIGADGILVLNQLPGEALPTNLTIINQDGSKAKNCGNGLRCAAASIYSRHQEEAKKSEELNQVNLSVEGRNFHCQFFPGDKPNAIPMISVDMGLIKLNAQNTWHQGMQSQLADEKLADQKELGEVFSADIGNQHLVFLSDSCHNPLEMLKEIGPKLQKSAHWDGINVHIALESTWQDSELNLAKKSLGAQVGDLYEAWVFERGVGLTQACGSGACAIGASVLAQGFANRDEWIGIKMPGGTVFVKQIDPNESVLLAGSASFVFSGSYDL